MIPIIPKSKPQKPIKTEPVNTPEMVVALREHQVAHELKEKAFADMAKAERTEDADLMQDAQSRFDAAVVSKALAWKKCEAADAAREAAGIPAYRVVEEETS